MSTTWSSCSLCNYWALAKWGELMIGSIIVLHVDSLVALHCLRKMMTNSLVFVPLLHAVADLLLRHDASTSRMYISSAANILVDFLSRDGMDEFCS